MSGAELAAIIASAGALISSLAALVTALASYKRLGEVHAAVNGQSQVLSQAAHSQGFAQGYLERERLDPSD